MLASRFRSQPRRDMISADLAGKAVLVTGAASGIGLAAAEIFSRCGATVALNHLPDDPRGPDQVERLKAEGRRIVAAPGDVSRPGEAERMVDERDRGARPARFSRQQCRDAGDPGADPVLRPRRADRGFLVEDPDDQPDRPVPLRPCRGPGAEGGAWRDLQHRLDRRRSGLGQQHPLCDEQGGPHQSDAQPGAHLGARDPGQRGGAGLCRQPVEQGLAGGPQGHLDRAHAAQARLQARGHRRDDLLPVRRRRDDHRPDDHRRRRPDPVKRLTPSSPPRKRESRAGAVGRLRGSGSPLPRG